MVLLQNIRSLLELELDRFGSCHAIDDKLENLGLIAGKQRFQLLRAFPCGIDSVDGEDDIVLMDASSGCRSLFKTSDNHLGRVCEDEDLKAAIVEARC